MPQENDAPYVIVLFHKNFIWRMAAKNELSNTLRGNATT